MLPAKHRLRRAVDVERVFRRGRSLSGRDLAIRFLSNSQTESRIAVLVGKKLAKKAIQRNRIKRRLREILRLQITSIPRGLDLLIIARSANLIDNPFTELTQQITDLLTQLQNARS